MAKNLRPFRDWWLYQEYGSLRFSCRTIIHSAEQAQRFCKTLESLTSLRFRADNRRDTPYDTFSYRIRATTKPVLETYYFTESPKEVAPQIAHFQELNPDKKVFWIKDFSGHPEFKVGYKVVSV